LATVTLDRLSKRYDNAPAPAVDGVSLEIAHGEFMVLLGPSGCGKTTTLRMIAGLESITSGTLSIGGRPMNAVAAKDRDIAMVFQSYALYPHMTVAENLAFGLRRRSVPADEIRRRTAAVAETIGLTPLLARKPHALSGGQRQRVALGRAIVRDPEVFLFDEPLSNLDAALRVSTRAEIARLHRALGATMIYVTHDQVEAMTMGTRICIMNGGRIAQVGEPLAVYNRPADLFVAGFLGNPAMNLLPAKVVAGHRLHCAGADIALPEGRIAPLPVGRAVTLGIRPEHLVPADSAGGPARFGGTLSGVERLGAETVAAVALPGVADPLMVRVPGQAALAVGSAAAFAVDPARLHVFDSDGLSVVQVS
jgi:multiple sugar transport system ATP-binding protein